MYLYLIAAENGLIKVGKTARIRDRVQHIKSSSPIMCELMFFCEYSEEDVKLEEDLHEQWKYERIKGEWFALTASDLIDKLGHLDPDFVNLVTLFESWGFFGRTANYRESYEGIGPFDSVMHRCQAFAAHLTNRRALFYNHNTCN